MHWILFQQVPFISHFWTLKLCSKYYYWMNRRLNIILLTPIVVIIQLVKLLCTDVYKSSQYQSHDVVLIKVYSVNSVWQSFMHFVMTIIKNNFMTIFWIHTTLWSVMLYMRFSYDLWNIFENEVVVVFVHLFEWQMIMMMGFCHSGNVKRGKIEIGREK